MFPATLCKILNKPRKDEKVPPFIHQTDRSPKRSFGVRAVEEVRIFHIAHCLLLKTVGHSAQESMHFSVCR